MRFFLLRRADGTGRRWRHEYADLRHQTDRAHLRTSVLPPTTRTRPPACTPVDHTVAHTHRRSNNNKISATIPCWRARAVSAEAAGGSHRAGNHARHPHGRADGVDGHGDEHGATCERADGSCEWQMRRAFAKMGARSDPGGDCAPREELRSRPRPSPNRWRRGAAPRDADIALSRSHSTEAAERRNGAAATRMQMSRYQRQ